MKNVKVIFTDTDYELVAKAYKQYDKLTENYSIEYANHHSQFEDIQSLKTKFRIQIILC